MRHSVLYWLAAAGLAVALPAVAATGLPGEVAPLEAPPIAWPEGPGKVIVQQKCLFCHSGEYITGQRLTPAQWTAEVKKMVKFGAPLSHDEQAVLAAYLAKYYHPGLPAAERTQVRLKPLGP
jgi:hypothetical protein